MGHIHNRASATAVINQIMSQANGIGSSKTEAKRQSTLLGQNGQRVSSKAHSIKSLQNLRSITTQYVNYIKENHGNRVVKHINNGTIKEFINHKLEQGNSQGTINTYISTLAKMSSNLNQIGIGTSKVSRTEITAYRKELKANGNDLQKNHINRAYNNPQAIVNEMRDSPYFLSAQLAYEVGLRADDAIHSDKWTLNFNNTLHITGSKNGINYTTHPLSDETLQRVRDAIENGFKGNYGEFREILKEAVENCNENWTGIHGLRYSFAQERLSEGITKSQISLEMGHSRIEVLDIYLAN
ncbi:MAG: tyrosine-type recombinase/integrase [Sulfurimonas sp.]|nr:tyrosine-type recombinase/integrase [Sulfurimonas sp.]